MAGLVPAIHDFLISRKKDVDARHKAGHDGTKHIAIARLVVPPAILYDMYHLK
jgi:hypothetical protein